MFEGKPPLPLHALTSVEGHYADEDLMAFSWSDLIGRLCATRELGAALAHVPDAARASFDGMTAQHLANRRAFALHKGKQDVNPVASGNGKGAGSKDGSGAASAHSALRGIA